MSVKEEALATRASNDLKTAEELVVKITVEDNANAQEIIAAEESYNEKDFKRLSRKVDMIIMPLLMLTYGLQYSDKVSLSSGVVFGLKKDTHLVGQQYANLTTWFYLASLLAQFPMMWLLQRFPLGRALAITCIIWGGLVAALGGCNTYSQLAAVRFFLGWAESVVTPGFLIIIASWYKRTEMTLRNFLFLAMNTFFAIVFGLIIYFLGKHAEESGGPAGWRVINWFLGGLTIFDGILLLLFLGTPAEVWWLTKDQKKVAHARIISNANGGGESQPWKWSQVREAFTDPQYYFFLLFGFASSIPNGGLGTFNTLIYVSFGFSNTEAILYGLPSYAIACVFVIATGAMVNRYPKLRFPNAILWQVVTLIILLYVGLNTNAAKWKKWAAFAFNGVFPITSFMIWTIIPVNIAGRTKKSFYSASLFVFINVGNMAGAQVFRSSDAPLYRHGLVACAAVIAFQIVNVAFAWAYYIYENSKREKAFVASGLTIEQREHLSKIAGENDLTDKENIHFRYTC